jgi:hypothetical protein
MCAAAVPRPPDTRQHSQRQHVHATPCIATPARPPKMLAAQELMGKIDREYAKIMENPDHPLDKELELLRKCVALPTPLSPPKRDVPCSNKHDFRRPPRNCALCGTPAGTLSLRCRGIYKLNYNLKAKGGSARGPPLEDGDEEGSPEADADDSGPPQRRSQPGRVSNPGTAASLPPRRKSASATPRSSQPGLAADTSGLAGSSGGGRALPESGGAGAPPALVAGQAPWPVPFPPPPLPTAGLATEAPPGPALGPLQARGLHGASALRARGGTFSSRSGAQHSTPLQQPGPGLAAGKAVTPCVLRRAARRTSARRGCRCSPRRTCRLACSARHHTETPTPAAQEWN